MVISADRGRRPIPSRLLSVIAWLRDPGELALLDHALFSIACQDHQPVEVLAVTRSTEREGVARIVEMHAQLGGFEHRILVDERPPWPDLVNEAIQLARGRYLALLDSGALVYPAHYTRAIQELERSRAGWCVSRMRLCSLAAENVPTGEPYILSKREPHLPGPFSLAYFFLRPPSACALVFDRHRLGDALPTFSWRRGPPEADPCLIHLATARPPRVVPGPASCEERLVGPAFTRTLADTLHAAALLPSGELPAYAIHAVVRSAMAEQMSQKLRTRAPRVHARFKRVVEQLLRMARASPDAGER
jgi:hypothetical protein